MELLKGKQVAITGKLASMTRAEALGLVRACGGEFVRSVNGQTSILLVGEGCWPLRKDGRITKLLQTAQRLQKAGSSIVIVSEDELLTQLGQDRANGVHRLYTLAQLMDLVNMPRNRVRAWVQAGLIRPVEMVNGIGYFDFRQVVTAKTLCELTGNGVSKKRIRRSLEQLKAWLPRVDQPLDQLAFLEKNGQILVRLEEGLMEPTGQMYFDFGEDQAVISMDRTSAEQWFEMACQNEVEGFLDDALHAYREALLLGGPSGDVCFNLANVLYSLDHKEEAGERYRQVVELNQQHAEAWNNLGVVLGDLGQYEEAQSAFRRAIQLNYIDAEYNLADLLDGLGRTPEACEHWKAYLRVEPRGPWSVYAKSRLA